MPPPFFAMREELIMFISQGGAFRAGYDLLQRAGHMPPAHLVGVMQRGSVLPSDMDALIAALKAVLRDLPAEVVTEAEPEAIADLRRQGKHLLKLRAHLRGMLRQASSDGERYDIAHRIMSEVVPRIDTVYDAVRAWERNGSVPHQVSSEEAIVAETVQKFKRRESLRTSIAALKRSMRGMAVTTKAEAELKLAEMEAEYATLNKALGV